ncbi:hypothetical protein HDU96_001556 [Phlyctochytrium bullatum]|nr:hypothetical protein HDU96_001556 [Phlyctochytrium bullatum]
MADDILTQVASLDYSTDHPHPYDAMLPSHYQTSGAVPSYYATNYYGYETSNDGHHLGTPVTGGTPPRGSITTNPSSTEPYTSSPHSHHHAPHLASHHHHHHSTPQRQPHHTSAYYDAYGIPTATAATGPNGYAAVPGIPVGASTGTTGGASAGPAPPPADLASSVLASVVQGVPWKPIFQRLPGTWLLLLLPFSVLGPVYLPVLYAFYYLLLHVLFVLNNLRTAYAIRVAYTQAKLHSTTDWLQKYMDDTNTVSGSDTRHDMPYDHVIHVIILPNYKEDMDTLCETLDVLASHNRAVSQYKICLAMEEGESGCQQKAHELIKLYANSFFDITYTVHPLGRPGEIRGKSSNVAWAVSQMALRGSSEYQQSLQNHLNGLHHLPHGVRPGAHSHEIVTVMDADTCFAEDYFTAITYHYASATPEERRIMMFAPSTVFDRNANSVPIFVRTTDMLWSVGVMSNLYPSSPVKIPCSAYSVSMDLCLSVGFWDAGPEAIGEDMHMYLKCFFSTDGKVIVKSVYSPASSCNIEGHSTTGWVGFFSGISARYTQATRHLWGSLDTGYSLRRALSSLLAPEPAINSRRDDPAAKGANANAGFDLSKLFALFHRLLEAHVVMGHFFVLLIVSAFLLPIDTAISYDLASWIWEFVSEDPVHPYVEMAVNLCGWLRVFVLLPNILMIYYYEKYHRWVGFERWALQEQDRLDEIRSKMMHHAPTWASGGMVNGAGGGAGVVPGGLYGYGGSGPSTPSSAFPEAYPADGITGAAASRLTEPLHPQHAMSSHNTDRRIGEAAASMAGVRISDRHRHLRVQHLGRRPQLAAAREFPRCLLDWLVIPVSGFLFYVVPQFHAQLSHLFTDSLEYKVAAKPQLVRPPVHPLLLDPTAQKQPPSYSQAASATAAVPPAVVPSPMGQAPPPPHHSHLQPHAHHAAHHHHHHHHNVPHSVSAFGATAPVASVGSRTYLGYHPPPSPSLGHGVLAPPSPVPASAVRIPGRSSSSGSNNNGSASSSSAAGVAGGSTSTGTGAGRASSSGGSSLGRSPPSYEAAASASAFFDDMHHHHDFSYGAGAATTDFHSASASTTASSSSSASTAVSPIPSAAAIGTPSVTAARSPGPLTIRTRASTANAGPQSAGPVLAAGGGAYTQSGPAGYGAGGVPHYGGEGGAVSAGGVGMTRGGGRGGSAAGSAAGLLSPPSKLTSAAAALFGGSGASPKRD